MIIKCPECGAEISDKAVSCPKCGCPISKQKSTSKKRSHGFLIVVICIVGFIVILGVSGAITNRQMEEATERNNELTEKNRYRTIVRNREIKDMDNGTYDPHKDYEYDKDNFFDDED